MDKIWTYYGIAAVPIVFSPMFMTLKQRTMKTLWFGYCLLGFILGILTVGQDKDNKDKKGIK
jgi:hypothetical protein